MAQPTVKFSQVHSPSPRIKGTVQGLQATVRYKVDWADAFTFVNEALGFTDGQPWKWPASPNMRATDASIEPVGVQSGGGSGGGSVPGTYYESALVDVTFTSASAVLAMTGTAEQPPANNFDPVDPIEMSSYQVQYSAMAIKIPPGTLKWSDKNNEGNAQSVPAGIRAPGSGSDYMRVPTFTLAITLHNCLTIDPSRIAALIGCTNDRRLFGICAEETLVLEGVSTSRRQMSDGTSILDVTLNYKWLKVGWNYAMADNGVLYRYTDKNGTPIYSKANIHPLEVIEPTSRWKPGTITHAH